MLNRQTYISALKAKYLLVLVLLFAFKLSHSQCLVNQLNINTGYNPATNSIYPIGVQDQYWSITYNSASNQVVAPATPPYQSYTVTPNPAWTTNVNTRWVCFLSNPNYSTIFTSNDSTYQNNYTRHFNNCLADTFTFNIQWAADNWLSSFIVDGVTYFTQGVQSSSSQFNTYHTIAPFSVYLTPGNHQIDAVVFNYPAGGTNPTGLNIIGTITGTTASLLRDTCSLITSMTLSSLLDTICVDSSVTITASGAAAYTWSPATGLNTTSGPTVIASPLTTTTYYVTANVCNGTITDSVTVKVIPFYTLSAGPDTTTCVRNSLQLYATVGALPGTYTINWAPATYLNNSAITNPVLQNAQNSINYAVTVAHIVGNVSCFTIDTVKIKVLQGFVVDNHDSTICKGSSVQINATGDPRYSYKWTPNIWVSNPNIINPVITPDSTVIYTVTASFPGCNDSMNRLKISVEPVPFVIAGPDREVCTGDTIHMQALVAPPFNYKYSWTPGSSMSNPNILDPVFTAKTKGTAAYTISVTTPVAKCNSLDSMHINVVKRNFLRMLTNDTAVCPLDTFQVGVVADSDILLKVIWASNEKYIDSPKSFYPIIAPTASADYYVYGIDTAGCHDTIAMKVVVNPVAVIRIPDTITLYPGDSYLISPETNCLLFKWFPASGLSADSISNPIAMPAVNTQYIVTGLTEFGCITTDTINFRISPDSRIDVPNAFTPGMGPNPVFKIVHIGEATLHSLSIYNRWGQKIFESNDINKGWDGTFNGQAQPIGVYIYMVEAYSYKGVRFYKQGNVNLLR